MTSRSHRRSAVLPLLTSAFTITALTAMVLMQGRAYREGWLSYFGLDSAQFPSNSSDIYWLALNGWLYTAVNWFKDAWSIYLTALLKYGWLFFVVIFGLWFLAWADRRRRINQKEQSAHGDEVNRASDAWLAASDIRSWTLRAVISAAFAAISMAVLPTLLFFGGALLVILIATTVAPFEKAGREAAARFCAQPTSQVAKVILVEGETPAAGYRIECNTEFCALIERGQVYVVPVESVRRLEIPRLSPSEIQTKTAKATRGFCGRE